AERFGIPPFSVLNAREGWWQARKQAWLALGIKSENGRGENLLHMSEQMIAAQNGGDPYGTREPKHSAAPGGGGGGRGSVWLHKSGERMTANAGAINAPES